MKEKLKLLWFGIVPLAWYINFKFIELIQDYSIKNWDGPIALGLFLTALELVVPVLIFLGAISLAFYLQD